MQPLTSAMFSLRIEKRQTIENYTRERFSVYKLSYMCIYEHKYTHAEKKRVSVCVCVLLCGQV